MQPTAYPYVNQLPDILLSGMQGILGDKLVGLYLYGSLVTGDFDLDISDIDLLAATSIDIDEADFAGLQKMHDDLARQNPAWDGRIEIAYLSLDALKTFKTKRSQIGIISPGEPFHLIEGGSDWLMNWYMVLVKGVTLFGPPPGSIIAPITKDEFIQAVKAHMAAWRGWIPHLDTRPSQAYSILTVCRGLYTCTHAEQVSKRQAALWAQKELPEWSTLIQNALVWRTAYRDHDVDHDATVPETRRFVNFVIDRLLG